MVDIEGGDSEHEPRFRKALKLIAPHAGLVILCCLYASAGAFMFYQIESPHENQVRNSSVHRLLKNQELLLKQLWLRSRRGDNKLNKEQWKKVTIRDFLQSTGFPVGTAEALFEKTANEYLDAYSSTLFNAFTREFVRYDDVWATATENKLKKQLETVKAGKKKQKRAVKINKSSSNKKKEDNNNNNKHSHKNAAQSVQQLTRELQASKRTQLWTGSSAVFFAATTMATIGYGNIVPVTTTGRIFCVCFALIGAPLAIITIGDLGKFLSECTIWLYKRLKMAKSVCGEMCARLRRRFSDSRSNNIVTEVVTSEDTDANAPAVGENEKSADVIDLDDDFDKTQVPVWLVFSVLLTYIALGAVLFSFIERWTYVDSFYFCFITLTTVGFGDLVPERHAYLVLMLLYIGVGLSVTTMCIDLVGITYLRKIHYFGRKFKGTDFMSILRRRRMLQKQLLSAGMGADERLLQTFIQQLEAQATQHDNVKDPWEVDNVYSDSDASTASLASTVEERAMMYRRRQFRVSSWSATGPAASAKFSRRTGSCPENAIRAPPSPVGMAFMEEWESFMQMLEESQRSRPPDLNVEVASSSDEDIGPPPLLSPPTSPSATPFTESTDSMLELPADQEEQIIYCENAAVYESSTKAKDTEQALEDVIHCPDKYLSKEAPKIVTDNFCFVVEGEINESKRQKKMDEHWWKPTGKATKYYWSKDLVKFYSVTVVTTRGKIMAAQCRRPPAELVSDQVRNAENKPVRRMRRINHPINVPLTEVFSVSRYYSCWRTCAFFHRIISIVQPLEQEGEDMLGFKRRCFVQYLWRNAKEADKRRVEFEYNMMIAKERGRRRSSAHRASTPARARLVNRMKSEPPPAQFFGESNTTSRRGSSVSSTSSNEDNRRQSSSRSDSLKQQIGSSRAFKLRMNKLTAANDNDRKSPNVGSNTNLTLGNEIDTDIDNTLVQRRKSKAAASSSRLNLSKTNS